MHVILSFILQFLGTKTEALTSKEQTWSPSFVTSHSLFKSLTKSLNKFGRFLPYHASKHSQVKKSRGEIYNIPEYTYDVS